MHVSSAMASSLEALFAAAENNGLHLLLSSGYRSYAYQVQVYGRIVQSQGQGSADEQSARPGYSEHQTGLAADIAPLSRKCDLQQCFAQTLEGQWLAANAYKYGFIIRYPADKQATTGYEYEPWHIRYVGADLAAEMHKQGIETLEDFFSVGGGTTYR
jgi:D-alanyl-D-alanine carboxypeptidase